MYLGDTLAEPMRDLPLHERQASGHYASYAAPTRAQADLPSHYEPRPSESSRPNHVNVFAPRGPQGPAQSPMSGHTDPRPTHHVLPRLHDIVDQIHIRGSSVAAFPASPPHGQASYANPSWQSIPPTTQGPVASSLQSRPGHKVDLPILETPVGRQGHVPTTHSPYSTYPDSTRDSNGYRREEVVQGHQSNGVNGHPPHIPYISNGPDHGQHYRSASTTDHSVGRYSGPTNVETSNKTFLRAEEVPGQGKFYVYEGGHRIPAQVDGEAVNPNWGLTKAMRPRKRLAQACLDCREKKIKCEPGQSNTCVQCEKAKRPCRRPTTQQQHAQSEGGSTATWGNTADSPNSRGPPEQMLSRNHDPDTECFSRRRFRDDPSPYEMPNKKHRSMSPPLPHGDEPAVRADSVNFHESPMVPRSPVRTLRADTDPYMVDSEKTIRLLESFLYNVNDTTYLLYPHDYFVYWAKTSSGKCPDELLVLYAILALGSVYIRDAAVSAGQQGADLMGEALRSMGQRCADIVSEALRNRSEALRNKSDTLTLPIAQSRLLLALYCYSQDDALVASEHLSLAVNTLTYLHLNTETGCLAIDAGEQHAFRFDSAQIAECRRRTMWAAFLMERHLSTSTYRIDVHDMVVRLPCSGSAYEQSRQQMSDAPFLHSTCSSDRAIVPSASPMASLIPIAALLGDVNNFVSRGLHSHRGHYEKTFDPQCEELWALLQNWRSQLPEHLSSSRTNIDRCIHEGYASHYLHMWAMYYWSVIKLHRYYRHEWLPKRRAVHITRAYEAAKDFLSMATTLRSVWGEVSKSNSLTQSASPFVGRAIVAAVDVLAAAGLESTMRVIYDLTLAAAHCVTDLFEIWKATKAQHDACQHRPLQILNIMQHPTRARSGCWVRKEWGLDRRLEEEYPLDYDGIYGAANPDNDYFDALHAMSRNHNNNNDNINHHTARGP